MTQAGPAIGLAPAIVAPEVLARFAPLPADEDSLFRRPEPAASVQVVALPKPQRWLTSTFRRVLILLAILTLLVVGITLVVTARVNSRSHFDTPYKTQTEGSQR